MSNTTTQCTTENLQTNENRIIMLCRLMMVLAQKPVGTLTYVRVSSVTMITVAYTFFMPFVTAAAAANQCVCVNCVRV